MIFLTAFWLLLPAGVANMVPVISGRIPLLNKWKTPLDFDKKYRGKRIFGPNKTWRGLFTGVVFATAILGFQVYLFTFYGWARDISWINYSSVNIWLLGPLFGAGALIGDPVESFFKRQRGIEAGRRWIPFDQIDYIAGALIFTSPFTDLTLGLVAAVLLVYFTLHLAVVYIFFQLGVREKPI